MALSKQLEIYTLMLAKIDKRIEDEANEAARLSQEESAYWSERSSGVLRL